MRRVEIVEDTRSQRSSATGTACEGALWAPGTFVTGYAKNRAEAAEQLIENDKVACAVRKLAAPGRIWTGTATQLQVAVDLLGDSTLTPRGLAGHLRNFEPRLRKVGITVEFDRSGHNRDRMIRIARKPDQAGGGPEASSASSADPSDEGGGQPGARPEDPVQRLSNTCRRIQARKSAFSEIIGIAPQRNTKLAQH